MSSQEPTRAEKLVDELRRERKAVRDADYLQTLLRLRTVPRVDVKRTTRVLRFFFRTEREEIPLDGWVANELYSALDIVIETHRSRVTDIEAELGMYAD